MGAAFVVLGAFVVLWALSQKEGDPVTPFIGPAPAPAGFDNGNTERAERLIGTIGGADVGRNDLASLDGFHPWADRWDREIYYFCESRYRLVSPVLAKAIMAQESSFNPKAVRAEPRIGDKSIGLMQLLTATAAWVAPFRDLSKEQIEEKLYDPLTNISVGLKYLTWQIGRYGRATDAEIDKVIAAYNAGSAKYAADGKFINQSYVNNVRGRMKVYAHNFPPLRTK